MLNTTNKFAGILQYRIWYKLVTVTIKKLLVEVKFKLYLFKYFSTL